MYDLAAYGGERGGIGASCTTTSYQYAGKQTKEGQSGGGCEDPNL